ncbi:hypothetical protein [Candidatus Methylobacter oryzae]|uniref:hypothetical protein n=1 Tax=Candidatus Methylobacter oryzae TaxID=2497749 RepID=UPI000F8E5784|nr:hypothetical protein [Candidatus Methylobacter oryzae]
MTTSTKQLTPHSALSAPGSSTGDFSDADAQQQLADVTAQLNAKVASIRQQAGAMFGAISNSGGALPVIEIGDLRGVHVVFDMNKYRDQFSVIGTLIIALAFVTALTIILG